MLRYDGGADDVGVLDLLDRFQQRGRKQHVADPPACEAVRLAERVDAHGVVLRPGDGSGREVTRAVVQKVLVHLVAHVEQTPLRAQRVHRPQVGLRIHRPARIVGRDGDHGAGARADGGLDRGEVELIALVRRHHHRPAADDAHCHLVVEEVGLDEHHLVALVADGEQRGEEGHVPARRHHQRETLRFDAVLGREPGRDPLAKLRDPLLVLVLVSCRLLAEAHERLVGGGGRRIVHDALSQRDRSGMASDEITDPGDDGDLHGPHPPRDQGRWRVQGGLSLRASGLAVGPSRRCSPAPGSIRESCSRRSGRTIYPPSHVPHPRTA